MSLVPHCDDGEDTCVYVHGCIQFFRLVSELDRLQMKLKELQNLEKTFGTSVQWHTRSAPEDRAYYESMLHPTVTAVEVTESTIDKILSTEPTDLDFIRELKNVKSWVDVRLDLVTTNRGLLKKLQDDLESLFDRLRYFEAKLDLEKQMLEEKRREDMLYMEHLERLFMYSAALVKKLLEAMLACCDITVLPNRHRPPCRTMPWDILPSLVILWGVCWMFYTPPGTPFLDESWPRIQANNYEVGYPVAQVTEESGLAQTHPIWNDNHFDFASLDFEVMFDLPQPLNTWYDVDQTQVSIVQMQGETVLPSPPQIYPDRLLRQSPPPDPKTNQISSNLANHNSSARPAAPAATTISNVESARRPALEFASGLHSLAGSNQIFPDSGSTGTHDMSTELALERSGNMDNSVRSQMEPVPSFRCDRNGCEDITFQCKSTWQRHIDKHTRPFKCDVVGCTRIEGFSTKGLLDRHLRMHTQASSSQTAMRSGNASFYCPESTCDRSDSSPSNKPFTRKDNRDDHVKRKHGSCATRQPPATCDDSVIALEGESSTGSAPEEQRVSIPHVMGMAPATGKRKRAETNETVTDPTQTIVADCSHGAEIDDLKEEVRVLKRQLAASKEKEEALFAALIQATKDRNKDG